MRTPPELIDTAGAAPGDALVYDNATDEYAPSDVVLAVVAGTNVTVDSTDPKRPVVSATGGGGGAGEVLMQDGVTNPPVPLTNEAGTDWLYQG